MLTALRLVMPKLSDAHYGMMAEYCIKKAQYYTDNGELEKGAYWAQRACKYLSKRMDLLQRRGLL